MTYRIQKINYQLIPRFNISSMTGTLPVIYSVPVLSNKLPTPSVSAFTSFANCRI